MKKKLWLIFVLALVIVSCAPALRVHHFAGGPGYPPTAPESVDLLRAEPRRPYVAFAEIIYEPPQRVSRREVEWKLRRKGAAIGADALIIETDSVYRDGVYRPNRVRRARSDPRDGTLDRVIVAVAIRYRRK
ncbi:MAG TPA: hypothetical protein VMZ49_02465 [Patescibacteria group bacterium]|nr:hypothetical protein [Patescibacteria group bacterium]